MSGLVQIQEMVAERTDQIASAHGAWPCRKGCDDCCRSLASEPRVSQAEWTLIRTTIDSLPADVGHAVEQRIRQGAGRQRPVACPMLDVDSAVCLIYEARPIACRTYGFYAEREAVLGCSRIESLADTSLGIVWGNHLMVEDRLRKLGPPVELSEWLQG